MKHSVLSLFCTGNLNNCGVTSLEQPDSLLEIGAAPERQPVELLPRQLEHQLEVHVAQVPLQVTPATGENVERKN